MQLSEADKIAINDMFSCRNLLEHMACYQHYSDQLENWTFIVFSENNGSKLPDALCTNYDKKFAVINLGCGNRCYAMNKNIYEEMLVTGKSDHYIDVCIELDTQAVSYLKNVFQKYDQRPNYDDIKDLVHYLQLPNVNYSCLPYLVENAAKKDRINIIECYKNIKSYMLFKSFNYKKMLQNERNIYEKSEEDIQIDTDSLYNDFLSDKFIQYYGDYAELQKTIYILLTKAICIEFTNSKRSAKNKMMDLIDFVNEKLGIIGERELEICYRYFEHDSRTKKFFKKIQKNSKELSDSINGMAWDLVHIRLIEREYMTKLVDNVRYAIHMLLTFDNGLKEILQINPIEQIALGNGIAIPKLKNNWLNNMDDIYEKIKGKENEGERQQTFATRDILSLCRETEEELKELCDKI